MLVFVVLISAVSTSVYSFNLTLLHTNDVHSRFEQFNTFGSRCTESSAAKGECFGGVARQFTKVKEIRETYPNTLFLSAGDYYQGTFMYTLHKWRIVADFMNRLGHDVMAIGNHELDDGVEGLVPLIEHAKFPIISCNLNMSREPSIEGKVSPYVIKEVGGRRIGIIGYTTPDTMFLSRTGKLLFTDEIECINKTAKALHESGVDIIIAVGHSGFPKDVEIAEAVGYLDIVVGGHTDTFLYSGTPPSIEEPVDEYPTVIMHADGKKTLVVQDYTFGKYMGFLEVQFDDEGNVQRWGGNPILLDNSVTQDPEILRALQPYVDDVAAEAGKTVGKTKVLLRGDRLVCRMEECNMGNMLTDALVDYFSDYPKEYGWTKVPIAIWNSGGIRSSIDETFIGGNITIEDIMTVAPFANTFSLADLRGEDLYTLMEQSASTYDPSAVDPPGKFLQVSGLKVLYDMSQPPLQRVQKLEARCGRCRVPKFQEVNRTAVYTIAVPAYVLGGGDGIDVFVEKAVAVRNTDVLDSDIIQTYLERHTSITTGVEGRIKFVSATTNSTVQHFPVVKRKRRSTYYQLQ